MPSLREIQKAPIQERIVELSKKIQLLEGDRKAYYESTQWSIKKNRNTILKLRQQNKNLHKTLAEVLAGDDQVIDEAFEGRHVARAALRNKTGKMAISVVDHKVCDSKKKLNALRSTSESFRGRKEELKMECSQIVKDDSAVLEMATGESIYAQQIRQLENKLDKAKLKSQEAEHIEKVYEKIKAHLQHDGLTFHNELDKQEADILKARQELLEVQALYFVAQVARDEAKEELLHLEDSVFRDRKEREVALARLKATAEERRAHAEQVERRLLRAQHEEHKREQEGKKPILSEAEQERKIALFEGIFLRIKEATGVSGIHEVVARFRAQIDTQCHLEDLQNENDLYINKLHTDRTKMQQEFEDLKYTEILQLSSCQLTLNEFEQRLKGKVERRNDAAAKLDFCGHLLIGLKAGVEHLADKLQLKKNYTRCDTSSPTVYDYVLDLLETAGTKLEELFTDFRGRDVGDILRQMEEEEFDSNIENKLPSYNTRIVMPDAPKHDTFDDEDESGEEDTTSPTRVDLKRRSQAIVDAKSKKVRGGRPGMK